MPPHRVKRARTFIIEAQRDSPPVTTTKETTQIVSITGDNGKSGLVKLPAELMHEIVSYFSAVPIPTSRRYNSPVLLPSTFERWDVLRALSQTCRLWRTIFFPMLWERMEACAVREFRIIRPASQAQQDFYNLRQDNILPGWYRDVSSLLERISTGLLNNPQVAKFVRTVNISLTRCSLYTVLPAFVECLENLPNLQTLQILHANVCMGKALKFHFEGHTFPTVRTIIVPDHGHDILRCCPEARKVVCNYGDGSRIITAIGKYCKNVEIVEDIKPDKNFLKRLAKACPNLRELKFNPGIETKTTEVLAALTLFKKLTRLDIPVIKNYADVYHKEPMITQIIKSGKNLLNNQVTGKKMLRISYTPDLLSNDKACAWTLDFSV